MTYFIATFIYLTGEEDFLSTNIFCGVFVEEKKRKKKTVERVDTWEIYILNNWTKTAVSFHFHSAKPFPLRIKKK